MAAKVQLPFDLQPLWRDAIAQVGLKSDAMAQLMGVSPQALDQMVSGQLSWQLDRLVWAATRDADARRVFVGFMRAVMDHIGADEREEVLAMFNEMVNRFQAFAVRRPVKAELPERREKKTA